MISNYATNIALIDRPTNMVINIIWGMVYQEEKFNNEIQYAVAFDDLAVSIGDIYDGENFYHNGEKVLSLSEMLSVALKELDDATKELEDADNALHELGVEWEEANE